MELALFFAIAQACAPQVAPATLSAIAQVESGRDPFTVGVNGAQASSLHFSSAESAGARAQDLLADGRNIDVGLLQINSRNLDALGITSREAFDPCTNLRAGARLLATAYREEVVSSDAPHALDNALSRYNTGDRLKGLRNGYVMKVHQAAARLAAQAAAPDDVPEIEHSSIVRLTAKRPAEPPTSPPSTDVDVFAQPPSTALVWRTAPETSAATHSTDRVIGDPS